MAAVAGAATIGPATIHAQPTTEFQGVEPGKKELTLRWEGPRDCSSAEDVRKRLGRLLGADAAKSPSVPLAVEGVVTVVDGQYHLSLTVHAGGRAADTRVFDSPSCESLAGAAAVMLALLIRGESGSDTKAESVPPPPHQEAGAGAPAAPVDNDAHPAASRPAAPAAPALAPAPGAAKKPAAWSVVFDAPGLTIDAGVLPSAAYGVSAGAGVQVGRLNVMLAGFLWLDQSGSAPGGYRGAFVRHSGELSGCYGWRVGYFDVGPCLLAKLENVMAQGAGPDVVPESGSATWLALGAGVQARWWVSRWAAVFLTPSAAISTSHPTFTIDGVGVIHRVPFGSVSATLGCQWIL